MITIETEKMSDIFVKHHILGLNKSVVIHEFTAPEPIDADAHNHPFDFYTFILHGGYVERKFKVNLDGTWSYEDIERLPGTFHYVDAYDIHLIIKLLDKKCETIMIPQHKVGIISSIWRFDEEIAKYRYWNEPEFKPADAWREIIEEDPKLAEALKKHEHARHRI